MRNKILAAILSLLLFSPAQGAMTFSGLAQRVTVGSVVNFAGDFTFAVWINPAGLPSTDLVLGNSTDGGQCFLGTLATNSSWSTRGALPGGVLTFNVPAMSNGRWYHLVLLRSGSTVRLYLDGVESSSGGQSDSNTFSFDTIMGYSFNVTLEWDGQGDDFRWYSRALSTSEIASLAGSRSRLPITDGLVGWWKMDDGTDGATAGGATVYDSSGNGKTGTPVGSPVWRASSWVNYP